MKNNKKCYYYKNFFFDKGLLDNIVDCCIVLLMENNKIREKSILKTITEYKLCKNTVIQYNKGFKKCYKKLYKQTSIYDINDAYYTAFKYSDLNKYKNILILEDDVIFDDNIKNPKIIKDLESLYKNEDVSMFHLGSHNFILYPRYLINNYFNCRKLIVVYQSHANIYSKKFRIIFNKEYESGKRLLSFDQDFFSLKYGNIYAYYKQLAFQPMDETENKENLKFMGVNIWKLILFFYKNILNLNIQNKPIESSNKIFKIFFLINILLYMVLLLIIIIILYKLKKLIK